MEEGPTQIPWMESRRCDAFHYETGIQYMPGEQVTYDLGFSYRQRDRTSPATEA